MKRFFAIAGAVAIGGLVAAGVAPAVEQAVTPKQYKALVKRVATLEKNVQALNVVTAQCLLHETAAVSVYGTETEGYVYGRADGSLHVTTALDITESGQTPHFYLLGIDPECAKLLGGTVSSIARQLASARTIASTGGEIAPARKKRNSR